MTKDELYSILRLKFLDIEFPPPSYGNGENVIEFNGMHSWPCLRAALESLNDENFKKVIKTTYTFTFHNNSNNGHTSVGADWSMRGFIRQNGSSKLQERLKNLTD